MLCLVVTLGQNYQAFLEDRIDWGGVVSTYLGIPLFLVFWLGYWLVKRKTWVSYADMRFDELDGNQAGSGRVTPLRRFAPSRRAPLSLRGRGQRSVGGGHLARCYLLGACLF